MLAISSIMLTLGFVDIAFCHQTMDDVVRIPHSMVRLIQQYLIPEP